MDEVLRNSRRKAKFVYLPAINLIRNEHLDCKCGSLIHIKRSGSLLLVYICSITIDVSMRGSNM